MGYYIQLEAVKRNSRLPYKLREDLHMPKKSVLAVDKFTVQYSSRYHLEIANSIQNTEDIELLVVTRDSKNQFYQKVRPVIYDNNYPILKAYIDADNNKDQKKKEMIINDMYNVLELILSNRTIINELLNKKNKKTNTNGVVEIYALPLKDILINAILEFYESSKNNKYGANTFGIKKHFNTYLDVRDFYLGIKEIAYRFPSLNNKVEALEKKYRRFINNETNVLLSNIDDEEFFEETPRNNYREMNWDSFMQEELRRDQYDSNEDDGRSYKLTPPKN